MPDLIALMRALESGTVTSRSLVESALAKSQYPAGEGRRICMRSMILDGMWISNYPPKIGKFFRKVEILR